MFGSYCMNHTTLKPIIGSKSLQKSKKKTQNWPQKTKPSNGCFENNLVVAVLLHTERNWIHWSFGFLPMMWPLNLFIGQFSKLSAIEFFSDNLNSNS